MWNQVLTAAKGDKAREKNNKRYSLEPVHTHLVQSLRRTRYYVCFGDAFCSTVINGCAAGGTGVLPSRTI
jgi:hypothetical protein